ncbi:carbohydrate sulfotransferase 11 [Eurytemora carolleeae]|uniref:carbohydrate sulfotransferase 11 n=1 Tax=Eurytemora carolleeae TaxID=1294199 RepID=UPI000C764AA8|nr:carbohydrate sulfotransferase 11 [Eurytemora carolleeae]|eukprot:XP_023336866.1 carbohydrate sulfotransferase 11-like [Eurytemora affinis]
MRIIQKYSQWMFLLLFFGFVALAAILFFHGQLFTESRVLDAINWEERVEKVKSVCDSMPVFLPSPPQLQQTNLNESLDESALNVFGKELVLNIVRIPALNLDWCLVPKVASSSLSKLFLPYLPATKDTDASYVQMELWQRAGHLSLKQFYSSKNIRFLISRHPFARLISAYRNKLENRTRNEYFFNQYSKQIIKLSRGTVEDNSSEPTFPEFVKFLLNTDITVDDEHWQPISLRCRLCQLEFTHILRYEDLSTDWEFFKQELNLPSSIVLPWDNRGNQGIQSEYLKLISREDLEKLRKRYESDFLMFGYNIEEF